MATEQIELGGENIFEGYKEEPEEDDEPEEKPEKTPRVTLPIIEIKPPEYYKMLNNVKLWKVRFPLECKDIDIKNENKLTMDELVNKNEQCKQAVAGRGDAQIHRIGFKMTLGIVECKLAPAAGFKLRGLTNTACADTEIIKCLDEIAMIHDLHTNTIGPEARLLVALGQLAFKIHAVNTNEEKVLQMPEDEGNIDDL
jgi:hypothetical protein